MTVSEAMEQIESNLNELGARPYVASPVSAEFDIADLKDQLAKIQETRACLNGVCSIGDWRPSAKG